jgi:hypothetical protein
MGIRIYLQSIYFIYIYRRRNDITHQMNADSRSMLSLKRDLFQF